MFNKLLSFLSLCALIHRAALQLRLHVVHEFIQTEETEGPGRYRQLSLYHLGTHKDLNSLILTLLYH